MQGGGNRTIWDFKDFKDMEAKKIKVLRQREEKKWKTRGRSGEDKKDVGSRKKEKIEESGNQRMEEGKEKQRMDAKIEIPREGILQERDANQPSCEWSGNKKGNQVDKEGKTIWIGYTMQKTGTQ